MSKRNYRKRRQVEEDEETNGTKEETVLDSLEERKELQKLRKRQKGVSAAGLAMGEEATPRQETEGDPFRGKTGGLWDMDVIKDRERDREGEEKERSISLGSSFAVETNRRDEDTHMLRYIEDEMKRRRGDVGQVNKIDPK